MSQSKRPGRISIAFAIVLGLFAAAPTVGDVGSCGQRADPLDAAAFFNARLDDTCKRCDDCGLSTSTRSCVRACDKKLPRPQTFPAGCKPIVHDAEVCLHAIAALSCADFEKMVSDLEPEVPTECDFCPAQDVDGGGS